MVPASGIERFVSYFLELFRPFFFFLHPHVQFSFFFSFASHSTGLLHAWVVELPRKHLLSRTVKMPLALAGDDLIEPQNFSPVCYFLSFALPDILHSFSG